LNADNYADVLIGTLRQGAGPPGYARVYSGIDGSTLYSLTGAEPSDQFGCSVAGAGDVDGDGVPDFVIGAQDEQNQTGSATVFSGATGQVLYKRFGLASSDFFGGTVSGCGDVDGDGLADVIVGARQPTNPFLNGYVRVFSGSGGVLLYSIQGPVVGARFGTDVHGGVDLNSDGHADFIVGAPFSNTPFNAAGGVAVFSGASGTALFGFAGTTALDHLGNVVRLVPDLNGDGHGDIVINAKILAGGGQVRVRSGVDGSLIRVLDQSTYGDGFGLSVAYVPDLNGDQFPELIVGAPRHDAPMAPDAGKVVVLSIGGARKFGINATQEMTLTWEPVSNLGLGDGHVAFGVGLVPGFVIVSVGESTTIVGNQTIVVDLTPGQWSQVPFVSDQNGSWTTPIDLTQVALDGVSFFLQAVQILPSSFIVSNGLQLLFCR
jgi:hypothetical protein